MIIERREEVNKIKNSKKWVLVYGRRKTGKTFLVENFIKYDEYFFVKRDGSIISKENDKIITYETFIEILKRALNTNKTVVVDEFHRLGENFFDFLHYTKKQGKLILISSTLFLSKKIFSTKSALLGLFAEVLITLINIEDCIKVLRKFKLNKKQLVELAILLREPIAVDYFNEKKKVREIFRDVLLYSVKTIPALIGEIFVEEERNISAIYEGILRAIANGKIVSSEISSYLFSRNLIKKDDPSIIQQYLNNLVELGIIKKIKVYEKNRFVYRHISPLAKFFYYADEKYNISERKISYMEAERIIDEIMPRIVEYNIGEFLASKFGLEETVIEAKDYGIDVCLLRFKKPEIVVEIKWKDHITKEDILKAEKNLNKLPAQKKLLFVPNKKRLSSESIDIIDINSL